MTCMPFSKQCASISLCCMDTEMRLGATSGKIHIMVFSGVFDS